MKISKIYESHGIQVNHIPMDESGIRTEILEDSGSDILHLSPSHHYPTGIVTSISRRYELLGWASKSERRYIIEDDYDSEFRLLGRPIPALQSIDVMDKVIYMNTFSKSLSSTIRISYMVLPEKLLGEFYAKLGFYSCTVSNFEQYTLARFISGDISKSILTGCVIITETSGICFWKVYVKVLYRDRLKLKKKMPDFIF